MHLELGKRCRCSSRGIAGAGQFKKGFQQGRDVVVYGGDAPDAPEVNNKPMKKAIKQQVATVILTLGKAPHWTNDETGRVATKDVAADLNSSILSNTSGGSTGGTAPTGGDAGSGAGGEAPKEVPRWHESPIR